MRRRHIGAAALAAAAMTMLGAPPAQARPSLDAVVQVLDAAEGACSNGSAFWQVRAQVDVTNTSEENDTFREVFYTGTYSVGAGQADVNESEIIDDGGLTVGHTIPPSATESFLPVVGISIPCNADSASLFVNLRLIGRDRLFSSGTEFLAAGTAVPTGAVGALGLVALVGVGVAVRRRRPVAARATVDA